MTTEDNIDKKYTARATTPYDLINWNSYVTFISETHVTSFFHNSQVLFCNQGRRQKKQDLWILFLLSSVTLVKKKTIIIILYTNDEKRQAKWICFCSAVSRRGLLLSVACNYRNNRILNRNL